MMRQAFAPVGTRLRRAAATEDGGESVFEGITGPGQLLTGAVSRPSPS
jgi:hypothetical protein